MKKLKIEQLGEDDQLPPSRPTGHSKAGPEAAGDSKENTEKARQQLEGALAKSSQRLHDELLSEMERQHSARRRPPLGD